MSVTVTFAGNTYSVPETGERGWGSLTNYLVALSTAATTTAFSQAIRTSALASVTVTTADFCVLCTFAGDQAVTLPAGVTKQMFFIGDKGGLGITNTLTISTTSSQQIDGALTYVIKSPYGGVWVQFDGTAWKILSVYQGNARTSKNNTTNTSVLDASVLGTATPATATNLQSCTFTLGAASNTYLFMVSLDTGQSVLCHASYVSASVSAVSDPSSIFLASDAGTGVVVTKSSSSGVVTVKNRMGGSRVVEIRNLTARLSSATAWS